jgi:uncharacterized protein
MPGVNPGSYAFNRTRGAYLATDLKVADTHWTRFRGLMATDASCFQHGQGLWITPCRGVHTIAMRFTIDVVYLDDDRVIVHLEEGLKPWRLAPVRLQATSVVELPDRTISSTGSTLGDQVEIALAGVGKEAETN